MRYASLEINPISLVSGIRRVNDRKFASPQYTLNLGPGRFSWLRACDPRWRRRRALHIRIDSHLLLYRLSIRHRRVHRRREGGPTPGLRFPCGHCPHIR